MRRTPDTARPTRSPRRPSSALRRSRPASRWRRASRSWRGRRRGRRGGRPRPPRGGRAPRSARAAHAGPPRRGRAVRDRGPSVFRPRQQAVGDTRACRRSRRWTPCSPSRASTRGSRPAERTIRSLESECAEWEPAVRRTRSRSARRRGRRCGRRPSGAISLPSTAGRARHMRSGDDRPWPSGHRPRFRSVGSVVFALAMIGPPDDIAPGCPNSRRRDRSGIESDQAVKVREVVGVPEPGQAAW